VDEEKLKDALASLFADAVVTNARVSGFASFENPLTTVPVIVVSLTDSNPETRRITIDALLRAAGYERFGLMLEETGRLNEHLKSPLLYA
jgi:hypothetical protein